MKCLPFLLMATLLAGCASTADSRNDLARYGTAPSEDDLYQFMSKNRDTLPPTRYVSYRDKGYLDAVKKTSYTDEQGQARYGWGYDFEVATYDTVDNNPVVWNPRRAIFFNGRLVFVQAQAQHPGNPTAPTPPAASNPPQ